MDLYHLKQRYQTERDIRTLASFGSDEQARALLQAVRDAIRSETERHYEYTERGGRGSPDGVAWEGALKRALEDRLGQLHQRLGYGADGWHWF